VGTSCQRVTVCCWGLGEDRGMLGTWGKEQEERYNSVEMR
jgi:hypothetical protein